MFGSTENPAFEGNLPTVFYAENSNSGTPGTYVTAAPGQFSQWTKQP
jgi:hypothetical protein